ncbi:mucin-7-like [Arachis ipaensis]|uniref:mucin-7-like n=1 Tax=Arachis ipaensis TaxID=130454 RepID=UPI0007AF50C1|nr:mucin-7-like [Arachis ipaensis]XP_025647543.1 mucin-7-like [Arachis hypogaea]
MESIHKTYAHSIQPVPSQEFWTRSEYSRPDPPIIKRPIGRPKVHNKQKGLAEPMMQHGAKLKRSFKVTCSKCGSEGHNYKTCKGAPSNPNWKVKTKKSKKGGKSQSLVVFPLSQNAPKDDDAPNTQSAASSQAASSQAPHVSSAVVATPSPVTPAPVSDQLQPGCVTRGTPFRPPLQVPSTAHQTVQPKTSKIRPKQKIFRLPAPTLSQFTPTSKSACTSTTSTTRCYTWPTTISSQARTEYSSFQGDIGSSKHSNNKTVQIHS